MQLSAFSIDNEILQTSVDTIMRKWKQTDGKKTLLALKQKMLKSLEISWDSLKTAVKNKAD